jgi:hypothetical protein
MKHHQTVFAHINNRLVLDIDTYIMDWKIALALQLYNEILPENINAHGETLPDTNLCENLASRGFDIYRQLIYWGGLIDYGWFTHSYNLEFVG